VQVLSFALTEGKVAVHCHAGLGRTGVLIGRTSTNQIAALPRYQSNHGIAKKQSNYSIAKKPVKSHHGKKPSYHR